MMLCYLKIFFSLCSPGVFGVDMKSVSVMEGDSVTLNSDLTEIQTHHLITWTFGHPETRIAEINKEARQWTLQHI